MPPRNKRTTSLKYLPDGDVIWKLYWEEMGLARSWVKVKRSLEAQGYRNPKTGKGPSQMAAYWRALRWAMRHENFDAAYEVFNKGHLDSGEFFTKEQFKQYLDHMANTVFQYSERDYQKYMAGKF